MSEITLKRKSARSSIYCIASGCTNKPSKEVYIGFCNKHRTWEKTLEVDGS